MALRRRAAWIFAAAALSLALAAGLVASRRTPAPGGETTLWMAAESLALDGDLRLDPVDLARFETRFGVAPRDIAVDGARLPKRYDAPGLWPRAAAVARRAAGVAGPYLFEAALVAGALLCAFSLLVPKLGATSATLLVVVALAGSALGFGAVRLDRHALGLFAMALAAWLVWYRPTGPASGPEDLYRGAPLGGVPASWRWLGWLRWLGAGGALGLVVAGSPAYLPLALPVAAAAPRGRRFRAWTLLAIGALATLAASVAVGGALWEPIETVLDLRLFGWAAAGLLAGRTIGIVPYFLPALLLLAGLGRSEGRRWVPLAVAGAVALQVVLAPFDFLEGSGPVGNAWFFAPYVLLLCAVEHGEARGWTLAPLVVALPLLASPWLADWGAGGLAARVGARLAPVDRRLPLPTTLRSIPRSTAIERSGLVVRGLAPGIVAGEKGKLRLAGSDGELVVASDRALSSIRVELGANAPADLEVEGGRLGNTILRPDGDVAVEVALDRGAARRHPLWWSRSGGWTYLVRLRLGGAARGPVALDVPFGRSLVPGGGAMRSGEGR